MKLIYFPGFIFAFYAVFLIVLMLMSSAFCGLFFWVIDWNFPTLQGASSILQVTLLNFSLLYNL